MLKEDNLGQVFSFHVISLLPVKQEASPPCSTWAFGVSRSLGAPTFSRTAPCPDMVPSTPSPQVWLSDQATVFAENIFFSSVGTETMETTAGAAQFLCKQANQKFMIADEKVPQELLTCSPSAAPGRVLCASDHRATGFPCPVPRC